MPPAAAASVPRLVTELPDSPNVYHSSGVGTEATGQAEGDGGGEALALADALADVETFPVKKALLLIDAVGEGVKEVLAVIVTLVVVDALVDDVRVGELDLLGVELPLLLGEVVVVALALALREAGLTCGVGHAMLRTRPLPKSPMYAAPVLASTAMPYGPLNRAVLAIPSAKPLTLPARLLMAPDEMRTDTMLPWPFSTTKTLPMGPIARP